MNNTFIHPCDVCAKHSVMGLPVVASAWKVNGKDGETYTCFACSIFGRTTVLSVFDFAQQVRENYWASYRIHRAKLHLGIDEEEV